MAELSTQRISTILGYRIEGEEDLKTLAETLGKTNEQTQKQTTETKQLTQAQKKNLAENRNKTAQSRRARTNQINLNRAMDEARNIIADNTLRLENLKLEYEQGNVSTEEYRFELQKLMNQMERLDVPLTAVPRRMRQLNREMQKTQTSTKGLDRNVGRASFAFTGFSQILQDAPFGLVAISNNIPQAAQGFSNLTRTTGSAGGALKALIGFATGPGGWLVAASSIISVLAVLIPKMDLFGDKTKEAAEANKELASAVKSGIGGVIDDLTDQQQVDVLNNALDKILGIDELPKSLKESDNQLQNLIDSVGVARDEFVSFNTARSDATQAQAEANVKAVEAANKSAIRQANVNDLIIEELNNRLAVARANQLVARSLREIGLQQEGNQEADMPELLDIYDSDVQDIDIDDELFTPVLDRRDELRAEFDTTWNYIKEAGIENFESLATEQARILEKVNNDTVIGEAQKFALRNRINERFAERRYQIEERNEKRITQLYDQQAEARKQIMANVAATIGGLLTSLFPDSKAAALASIAIQKGFAIAKVIINGIQEASRLTIMATANSVTPGFQGLAAAQFAAAAKVKANAAISAGLIAAQGLAQGAQALSSGGSRGGSSGGGQGVSYRQDYNGYKPGNDVGASQSSESSNKVMVVELRDRAGKFLTRLQNAQDREGGNNYLISPNSDGQ